ncbi:MAG TPA: phosphate ABC transporter substrate-binding protein PstS [Candidatus Nanopelagicales bacterium]|nr:phosphate ABC transporter substrate-binding protein PstS [Candidatus Nanopelagicales bacterium]
MNISKAAPLAAVALAGALALTACGSDNGGGSSTASGSSSIACESGSIKASGSSAQKNAMAAWINAYQVACSGATIDYQANGSGAGIKDFINKQTAFAGSDSALKDQDKTDADARCASGPAIDIPMVGGAIVAAYNLSGVDKLTLTPALLAQIYSGKVTKWNDPAIAAANSGVSLPDATIVAFHRSDSSGTTDNWTKYLAAQAKSDWTYDHAKDWPAAITSGQGAKGSDGVASSVKSTPNSIGYVELSFAQSQSLTSAWVDNGGGAVEPTSANAATTISSATVTGTGNDLALKIDYSTTKGYPIVLVTYEITCEKGLDSSLATLTKSFLTYTASDEAQGKLGSTGYVPITGDLLTKVRTAVSSISA